MTFSQKLKDPRTCRIFFSSPFGGMEDEREELTRKYFPQIHHLCSKRGLQFVAVDMRWGITSEASANSQVINICLKEIDRSDLFVGFFGQRYGWHGSEDAVLQENFDNAVGNYPWLNECRDKSVTELEFLHGHLNHPGALPAVICFRDKEYDDKIRAEGEAKGDKKQVFKYSPESDTSVKLMDDLKERCFNTRLKTLGVHMQYKTPEEGAKIMFDAIWKHLTEVLITDSDLKSQTARSLRLAQHDAFMLSRSQMYGDMSQHIQTLNKLVNSESVTNALITGEAGSGKSTLICNWIKDIKISLKSEVVVVYHFVGQVENSTNTQSILDQLLKELEYRVKGIQGEDNSAALSPETDSDEERDIMRKIAITTEKLAKFGKRAILIIDGLEKVLKKSKTEKHLYWLPTNLAHGSFLVVASPSTDTETVTELHGNRGFQLITVEPLTEETQKDFCVQTLKQNGKELSPSQLDRIIKVKQTENPLYLKIVLNELVVFGYFRLLDKKIDSLISCESVNELCTSVLHRLEEDYNDEEYPDNLVEQVMCTICLTRQGMSEAELINMFSIPSQLWFPLFFAMEIYTIKQSGCIQFGFHAFKEAVQRKYLQEKETKNKYLRCIVEYFKKQQKLLPIMYKENNVMIQRISHELPWACVQLDDKKGLKEVLSHVSIFTQFGSNLFDLLELWMKTGCTWEEVAELYIQAVEMKVAEIYLHVADQGLTKENIPGLMVLPDLQNIHNFLQICSSFTAKEKVSIKTVKLLEDLQGVTDVTDKLEVAKTDLACLYADMWQNAKAEQLHAEVLQQRLKRLGDLSNCTDSEREGIGNSYHGLAIIYMHMENYDKAEEYLWKSKELVEKSNTKYIGTCYLNLGLIYLHRKDYDKALEYSMKALEIDEELNFGYLPLSTAHLLLNIGLIYRRIFNFDEAMKYYKKSLEIKLNLIGEIHPDVCVSYINLGTIEMLKKNKVQSLEYYEKALHIYRACNTVDVDMGYIRCWENQIKGLTEVERMEEALDSFWKFFEILEREQKLGNTGLIDGTLPFTHCGIVEYLVSLGKHTEAERVLLSFMSSKACHTKDYVFLDMIDSKTDPKPSRPHHLTLDYAMDRFPEDPDLLRWKICGHIIPSGDTKQLLEIAEKVQSLFGISGLDAINQWLSEADPFPEEMFQEFNLLSLKYHPENVAFLSNICGSLRRQRRHAEAVPHLLRLTELTPDDPKVLLQIAQSSVLREDYDLNMAKKYCFMVKEGWQDPSLVATADQFLAVVAEVEEGEKERKNESSNS